MGFGRPGQRRSGAKNILPVRAEQIPLRSYPKRTVSVLGVNDLRRGRQDKAGCRAASQDRSVFSH